MYSIVENARIVISLLKAHNIRHIVLSPGGSNIPIVQGVQDDPFFKCYSVVDERSAMYVAIGLYLQTGEIIATSCTSAQATRNYVPGLTEAFYKHVPILAITMSKHPKYIGQEYMQCPIQTSLPIDAVKKSFSLPRINTEDDRELCVRITNEAILETTHHSKGPVQLNIEALDSETWVLEDVSLPEVRVIKRYSQQQLEGISLLNKKIMFLIGEHTPWGCEEIKALESFCEHHDAFIYTTHLSNFHNKYSLNALPVMIGSSWKYFYEELSPDIVICLGGIIGDYDVYFKLRGNLKEKTEVWRVNLDGNVVDTYGKLTKIFQMGVVDFCHLFNEVNNSSSHELFTKWKLALGQSQHEVTELPLSNMYVAQSLHNLIPYNSNIHFAILNSLRCWSLFSLDSTIKAYSNVGGFGIDGCLSTMIGQSFATNDKCFLIIGDLSFYYDMNIMGNRHIKNNVRILLINNNGGAEFKINKIHEQIDVSRYIAADNHFKNGKLWAQENGFLYLSCSTKKEVETNKKIFVEGNEKPILMEVFTDASLDKKAIELAHSSCRCFSVEEKEKRDSREKKKMILSKIVGEKGIEVIKKVLK